MNKMIKVFAMIFSLLASMPQTAFADYVGEMETTKYLDPTTVALIQTRQVQGTGLLAGDQISYIIEFTPTDNGGSIGGGGYVTDYIPAGVRVVDAQFVLENADGTFTQIAPPIPAAVTAAYLPLYSDTGIFYSIDSRTAMYTTTSSSSITASNGYTLAVQNPGCTGISLPSSTHNAWDNAMVTKFAGVTGMTGGSGCTAPAISTYNTGGLSPVAGPDAYLTLDSTGKVGPWNRIAYPGSMKATGTGVTGPVAGSCVGGALTTAGWDLSPANPLPSNTNAVRFAAGKVVVGELFTARITLRLTVDMPASGIINNTEVFGGDASLDLGNAAGHPSTWNQWRYFCPAVAVSNSNLTVLKSLVGTCIGIGCTPSPVTAGVVPNAANLKLRYQVQYINTGVAAQTNVVLTDTLATGAAYVASSYSQISGTTVGAPTGTTTLTFPTIASLAAGAGGIVQYDVNVATAQADGTALVNTAKLVSTQVPSPGVTSRAIATVFSQANLWIGKAAASPTVASGGTVTYTITIPNNGGTAVTGSSTTPITVNDYLPTDGLSTAVTDRFSYSTGTVVANTYTAAGVATAVTPAVTDVAPASAAATEAVTFKFTSGTIPIGGKMVITFTAKVGTNVPASATPYLNSANVFYSGGPGGTGASSSMSETVGTAPVTVTAPLSLTKKINCVYAGATCVPYSNGTISPGSKINYKLSYANISASTLSSLVLTDTLPLNTTFVTGTALQNGATAFAPTVAGQLLTFPTIATLAASPASGYVTFDVQLCTAVGTGCAAAITTGTDITNTTKLTASTFSAGVQASVTTSVRDQATLVITKTAAPSTIAIGGTTTYTLTVTNTGNAVASGIVVYDELPYTGTTAASRFNFNAGSNTFATTDTATNKLVAVTPATSVPPSTVTGFNVQTNRQEVSWTFNSLKELAVGQSFTLTYTATAGSTMPASVTPYTSDVVVTYISATNSMQASVSGAAPVTIGSVDHYELSLPTSSISCLSTSLTVTACANTSNPCTSAYAGANGTTATLATSGATLGATTVTFNASGVATTTLSYPAAANGTAATVTLSGEQTAATNPRMCCPDGASCIAANSCSTTFNKAGFIFSTAAGGGVATIPAQSAGLSGGTYYLRAVKTSDNTAHTCGAAFTGTQSISMAYECNDPTTCYAANLMSVNGGVATTIQRNNSGSVSGYTPVSMTFDSNGNAPFTFIYTDVGQVKLWANATVNSASVTGSSNAFVVKPYNFGVIACATLVGGICATAPADPGLTGGGSVFAKAGNTFNATVSALAFAGTVTPSFGLGSSNATETVDMTRTRVAPTATGAVDGTLGGTTSPLRSSFNNGVVTVTDLTWSEVGVITLTATNSTFLGNALTTTGTTGNIGRFYPDHFDTTATGPMSCPTGLCTTSMAYSGQPFSSAQVTARNAAGTTTSNYQGLFSKAVTLTAVASNGGAAILTSSPGGTLSANTVAATDFAVGVNTNTTSKPVFTFATIPTAPTDVFLRADESTGGDGVSSLRSPTTSSSEGSVKVVNGRVKIPNNYGSELLPLPVVATVQYYNGTNWLTSTTDSVTSLMLAATYNVTKNGTNTGTTTPSPSGAQTVSAGTLKITLAKPTGGAGSAMLNPTLPTYLPLMPSAGGIETFGVYKGNNSIIYMRENY